MDIERLLNHRIDPVEQTLTSRDCMLYAVSIGLGRDPLDPWALNFVQDRDLRAFPTMATIVGRPPGWVRWPGLPDGGVSLLHGAQKLTSLKPLPVGGSVIAEHRISEVVDKGQGRGALVIVERRLFDKADGDLIASLEWTLFQRGGGGFGGSAARFSPEPATPPDRDPDRTLTFAAPPDAALLYRLNGDFNPIHSDPEAARAAGFDRPLLHGLWLYGAVAAEVARTQDRTPTRIEARFSTPAFPGETLALDLWEAVDGLVFSLRVPARTAVCIDRGFIALD